MIRISSRYDEPEFTVDRDDGKSISFSGWGYVTRSDHRPVTPEFPDSWEELKQIVDDFLGETDAPIRP
jgi:hypothetical protein